MRVEVVRTDLACAIVAFRSLAQLSFGLQNDPEVIHRFGMERMKLERSLERRQRLRQTALHHSRDAQIEVRRDVIRLRGYGRLVVQRGLVERALPMKQIGQFIVPLGVASIQFQSFPETSDRRGRAPLPGENQSKISAKGSRGSVHEDGFSKKCAG